MIITINDKRKIHAIQEKFTELFPYLKLEFFSKPHKSKGGTAKKFMKSGSKTIGECRTVHKEGTITITPQMTVAQVEDTFRDVYGLSAQVFRKSGKIWLQTTVTDGWTLEEQNSQGKALSSGKNVAEEYEEAE